MTKAFQNFLWYDNSLPEKTQPQIDCLPVLFALALAQAAKLVCQTNGKIVVKAEPGPVSTVWG